MKEALRSWFVRPPSRGDWLIIGSAALTALTAFPLTGPYVVVMLPLLLFPFGVLWILRPLLGELGWPPTAIAVTAVGVGLLGCIVYLDGYLWHPDAQSGLLVLFVPLYQGGIIAIVTFLTVIVWAVRSDRQRKRLERKWPGT